MDLLMTTHTHDDTATIVLTGSIDLVTRQRVIDAGREQLDSGRELTIDMSGVSFIDSTGIGALVELDAAARAAGLSFKVGERSDRVERVLRITGLSEAWSAA